MLLASAPQMLVVKPDLKLDDFKSFQEHARKNPGGCPTPLLAAAALASHHGAAEERCGAIHRAHPVPRIPAAVTDMLAGNIDAMFAIIPAVLPQVHAGKMKALAVTDLKRSALPPEVPSVAELGYPQLESLAWIGLLAPAGMPAEDS